MTVHEAAARLLARIEEAAADGRLPAVLNHGAPQAGATAGLADTRRAMESLRLALSEQQATPDQAEITAEEAYARGYATRALSAVRRSSPYQSWEHKPLDRAWRDGWEAADRELRSEPTRN